MSKAQDLQQLIEQLQRGGATSAGRATPLFDSVAERVAPRNAVEQEVAQLWQELLGGDMPGVLDNFFDLGGHSLLGSQLISRIRSRFQQCLTLAEFLDEPTIERIARSLGSGADDTPIDADEAAVRYCLVPVQRNGEGDHSSVCRAWGQRQSSAWVGQGHGYAAAFTVCNALGSMARLSLTSASRIWPNTIFAA